MLEERLIVAIERADLGGEAVLAAPVAHADALADDLVGIGAADAAAGGADLALAAHALLRHIEQLVIGDDGVGGLGDPEAGTDLDAGGFQHLDLLAQDERIDDDAVADDALRAGVENAGGDEVQDGLDVADDDRVAGVVAALVTADHVGLGGNEVGDLPLAFVSPLAAKYHKQWHNRHSPSRIAVRADIWTGTNGRL